MPRFVVLRHDAPRGLHWDFMLEDGDVLATWALDQPPDSVVQQPAEPLPPHRRAYLDYEGPVSGDRGHVAQFDTGTYETLGRSDARWDVRLEGAKLRGVASLESIDNHWCFRWRADD